MTALGKKINFSSMTQAEKKSANTAASSNGRLRSDMNSTAERKGKKAIRCFAPAFPINTVLLYLRRAGVGTAERFFPKAAPFAIMVVRRGIRWCSDDEENTMKEKKVSTEHLNHFFFDMTRRSFWQLGINDATIARYVADVLTDFATTNNLY